MKEDSSKEYKIYLYLFIRRIPTPAIAGSVCINAKKGDNKERTNEWEERKKKGIEVERDKPLTPTWAIDVLIGDEEQTEKKKREQNEGNSKWASNPATLDYSGTS